MNERPKPPSTYNSHLPRAVDTVILTALEKPPDRRYASVDVFAKSFHFEAVLSKEKGDDVHLILSLSEADALRGTSYLIPKGVVSSEEVLVEIPPGTQDGQKIRLEEKGGPAKHGGPNGTLNVTISIRPDSRIERTFNQVSDNTQEIKHKIQSIRGLISRASVILGLILLIISGTFYVNSCNTYNSIIDQVGIARKAAINSMTTSSPILDDALSDNSKGDKWDTNKNCFFTNGTYSVTQAPADALTQPAPHTTCTAEATNFSNFVYQVTLTIVQGNCGGISFRTQQNNTDYYVLEVCQDGSYRVARFSDGNENDLISFTSSPAIRTGINRPNTIAVIANGRAFVMKVNYQEVTSVSDGSYSDGKIGVFAEAHTKQTMVAFNNAEVWNL